MIIPMKKYAFLIHNPDYHQFLVDMQELGVIDVVDKGIEPDEKTAGEIMRLQQFDKMIKLLKLKENDAKPTSSETDANAILDSLLHMQSESESLKQRIAALDKIYRSILPWGDFSKEDLKRLEDNGFFIRFYEVSERKFQESWQQEFNLEVISKHEGTTFFVIVQREGEKIEIDAEEVKAPDRSVSDVMEEKKTLTARMHEIESHFNDNARMFIPILQKARNEMDNKISFKKVIRNTGLEAADRLMIVEGWTPVSKTEKLNEFLSSKEVFYITSDPEPTDKVPIMLKNNSFSKLFEPIGKMYSLPKYGEIDLTPFFAPFFMLFFGFCLGDAGYGLLFLIGAFLFRKKVSADMKPVLTLLTWLGSITVIFGIISGTFFGMNLIEMIDGGKLQWMQSLRAFMLDSNQMFNFALVLGAVQIVYGMIIKAANQIKQSGLPYALTTVGWVIMIIGLAVVFGLKTEENNAIMGILMWVVLGISGVLILFFNNPGKNVFVNFGGGIWEVYSIATGVLGDLLSYIRLFALGVSSGILGYVFNDLATQMSGDTPVVSQIVMIIILLIGHGLNIFMATLGAFVHPMRLTFVEFYKNAGFTGGGKAYNPFSRK